MIYNFLFKMFHHGLFDRKSSIEQLSLSTFYKFYKKSGASSLNFRDVGFSCYSQNEEDGILLYIFSLIGTRNKKCIEVCCGDGLECNTTNLIVNHQWEGLLFDGSQKNVNKGSKYFRCHANTKIWPPKFYKAWITKNNINALIRASGFVGEVDLFSLDIDGVDYWVWKELEVVRPRVVVLEYNHLWGPGRAVTVPYCDDFVAEFTEYGSDYAGASIAAFVKLGQEKGYRLVGANAYSTNAFFVRDDIVCDWLPEVKPESLFEHSRAKFGMEVRFPKIKDKEWIDV